MNDVLFALVGRAPEQLKRRHLRERQNDKQ